MGDSWERKGADGSSGWMRLPAILSHGCLLPQIINSTQSYEWPALYPRNSNVILHSRVCARGGGGNAMHGWCGKPESRGSRKKLQNALLFMCHFIPTTCLKKKKKSSELFQTPRRGCHGALVNSPLVFPSPSDGLAAFRAFLRTEFSEENLEFWLACEEYKKIKSQSKMASKAKKIFAEYIAIQSCKEVSGSVPENSLCASSVAFFPVAHVCPLCLHR